MSTTGRVPYLVPYPHPSFPVPFGNDGQQAFHCIPVDDRLFHPGRSLPPNFQSGPFSPPFPQLPVNFNPPPEFGSYYLASPPESFVEYSTFSDGLNASAQINTHYTLPLHPHPMPSHPHLMSPHIHPSNKLDSYSHCRTSLGPQSIIPGPEILHQMLPLPHDLSIHGPLLAPAPQYFHPSPPHVLVSPPMAPIQSNLATGARGSVPFNDGSNLQVCSNLTFFTVKCF